jgi:hypothetical protein
VEEYLGTRETAVVSNRTILVICSLKISGWGHGLDRDKWQAPVNVVLNLQVLRGIA